jgi:hypothetical protein
LCEASGLVLKSKLWLENIIIESLSLKLRASALQSQLEQFVKQLLGHEPVALVTMLSGKMTALQGAHLSSERLCAGQTIPLKAGATTLVLGGRDKSPDDSAKSRFCY